MSLPTKQTILRLIKILNDNGNRILEVEEFDKSVSYWIISDFQLPIKNSVESTTFYMAKGIELTPFIELVGHQALSDVAFMQRFEAFLQQPNTIELSFKFDDQHRVKLYPA